MKTILALYKANAKEFTRDRMASFFTLLMPILIMAFFGMIFSGGGDQKFSIGLVNEDQGAVGKAITTSLTSEQSKAMLAVSVGGREEIMAAMNKGDLSVVLVLPAGLSDAVVKGTATDIPVYYDQARQTSYGVGLGLARNILADANLQIRGAQPIMVMKAETVQTTPLRSIDFFIPSMLAMAMLWLGLFGTTLPLVQQREQGVLRRLSASPVRRINLLLGQVSWRLTVGLIQAALFVLVGMFLFGVQIQGNWLLFIVFSVLGALMFISMGYLLCGLSRSTESAVALAQFVNFPLMFLSGLFFEPQMLPEFVRSILYIMPPAYLADGFRQIMVGYTPIFPLWLDFAVVSGFLVVFVALGLRFFRWESA
jgi:ABC-2 type transport system permease protein